MTEGQRTITYKRLMQLSTEKFIREIEYILKGRYLYRTIDLRLLDFGKGTEKQLYIRN